jgi:DNA-binding NarL/FixJ family response regulator
MLFFLYWMMQDYVHKDDIPASVIVEEKQPIFIVETEDKAKRIQCVLEILPEGKRLSVRQLDVLDGIICGKSRKEIAADLHLSENTVKMHTTSLFKALGVKSREEIYLLLKE